jgi:hypothetical protein
VEYYSQEEKIKVEVRRRWPKAAQTRPASTSVQPIATQFEFEKMMNLDFSSDASPKFGTSSGTTFLQRQRQAAAEQEAQRQHQLRLACLNGGQSLSQCGLRA